MKRQKRTDIRQTTDMRSPAEKQGPITKDDKEKYYRDLIIDMYRASGYSIEQSIGMAFASQGEELMRYLSDDKRHPLNRNRAEEVTAE
jgi:hypothetical protein